MYLTKHTNTTHKEEHKMEKTKVEELFSTVDVEDAYDLMKSINNIVKEYLVLKGKTLSDVSQSMELSEGHLTVTLTINVEG